MKKKSNELTIVSQSRIIHFFIIIFAVLILVFLIRWQVVQNSKFALLAKNRMQNSELDSLRGSIYASDGSTLAYTEPRVNVSVWIPDLQFFEKNNLQTRDELITKVAEVLEIDRAELNQKFIDQEKDGVYRVLLAEKLTKDKWEGIKALTTDIDPERSISGFNYEFIPIRVYPDGRLASHVLGLTSLYKDQLIGDAGLESRYNDALSPIEGIIFQERDARGQTITSSLLPTLEPQNGSSIYTSIDKTLQNIVQQKIKDGVERYKAKSGTVVIMDPKTGEVLALANYPDYDPNLREETNISAYGNLAITSPYEIGSVGKTFTLSAAIDTNTANSETVVLPNGHQGCEKIHNDLLPVCTWDQKPQPAMPLKDCFSKSDNLCFYHLASELSRKDFYDYLVKFGVGNKSGIDLSGESFGILTPYDEWNVGDISAFSYGHGYLMNVVQATNAVGSVANGGLRMLPTIVSKVEDGNGNVKEYSPTVVQRVISKESADKVVDMMRYNFESSTPEYEFWHLRNYDLAVKSGTALIATSQGYTEEVNNSFVGFDASSDRTFIMYVKLEEPKVPDNRFSFYNVRPLWLHIFHFIKDYLAVPTK